MGIPSNGMEICGTCMHRSYCLSLQNGLRTQRPIWDCNEYEHNDSDEISASQLYRVQAKGDNSLEELDREHIKGLCLNCDIRNSCMLPIAKGGVWHCEEYC